VGASCGVGYLVAQTFQVGGDGLGGGGHGSAPVYVRWGCGRVVERKGFILEMEPILDRQRVWLHPVAEFSRPSK
jgi:hypothetical protein